MQLLALHSPEHEGYDWADSVSDEPSLQNLAATIYFGMGDYSRRKWILNPNLQLADSTRAT
jgi:hypothetical protein